jgi:hypothetical protein
MQTNDGCKLPCWWGITPGTSSLSEIQAKLIPFSGISIYNSFPAYTGGNIGIYYPVDNLNFFLGVDYSLLSDKKTIKSIQVIANMDRTNGEGYLEEVRGSDSYNEIVSAYTLFGILSTFGPPPSVLIRAENRGEGKTTAYEPMDIVLVYPEQGLSIQYDMISERTADTFIGCPSTAFLNMWLVSPGDQDVLLLGNIPNAKPLEEATQMTVDEFYQAFKEPTDICVQTPVDIWPHP